MIDLHKVDVFSVKDERQARELIDAFLISASDAEEPHKGCLHGKADVLIRRFNIRTELTAELKATRRRASNLHDRLRSLCSMVLDGDIPTTVKRARARAILASLDNEGKTRTRSVGAEIDSEAPST